MQKSAYLILGMHRSGTSALTGVLARLGVAMPKTVMPISRDNPKGYFESVRIMQLNDALLHSLGSRWNDWGEVSATALADLSSSATLHEIMQTVLDEFDTDASIAIKDPRICRIAPPWIATLQVLDYHPLIVIPYRNPLEVARSLHSRDGMTIKSGLLLWLRHTLDAEYYSRGHPRAFVLMSDLLRDWQAVMDGVARDTNAQFPHAIADIGAEMDGFLDPQLKHFHADDGSSPGGDLLREWADGVFRSIGALDKKQDIEREQTYLDGIRGRLNEAAALLSGLVYETEQRADACQADAQRSAAAQAELQQQLTLLQKAITEQGIAAEARRETELSGQKALYEALIEDNARAYDADKNTLVARHDAMIEDINQKYGAELAAQKAAYETLIDDNSRAYNVEKDALASRHNETIERLKKKQKSELDAQKAANDALIEDNSRSYQAEKDALIERHKAEIAEMAKAHKAELAAQKAANDAFVQGHAKAHEVDRNALIARYSETIDKINQDHEAEMAALKLSNDNLVAEKDAKYVEDTEALKLLLNRYREGSFASFSKWALDKKTRP